MRLDIWIRDTCAQLIQKLKNHLFHTFWWSGPWSVVSGISTEFVLLIASLRSFFSSLFVINLNYTSWKLLSIKLARNDELQKPNLKFKMIHNQFYSPDSLQKFWKWNFQLKTLIFQEWKHIFLICGKHLKAYFLLFWHNNFNISIIFVDIHNFSVKVFKIAHLGPYADKTRASMSHSQNQVQFFFCKPFKYFCKISLDWVLISLSLIQECKKLFHL